MGDQATAVGGCDSAHKDRMAKLAGVFFDEYFLAEGKPDADALRKASGERFQAGLKVYGAAHSAAVALVTALFPTGMAAGS